MNKLVLHRRRTEGRLTPEAEDSIIDELHAVRQVIKNARKREETKHKRETKKEETSRDNFKTECMECGKVVYFSSKVLLQKGEVYIVCKNSKCNNKIKVVLGGI